MNKPMTYKGYTAKIEYSDEDKCLIGRISGIRNIVTFHGDSVKKIILNRTVPFCPSRLTKRIFSVLMQRERQHNGATSMWRC